MSTFEAFVLTKEDGSDQELAWTSFDESDLMAGDVTVDISHSTINYKDALALTGASPVVRRWPMIPGIDFAGTVSESSHAGIALGQRVILNGWGVGETHLGGYAQRARVPGEWLVPLPDAFTPSQAMAVGTAGYTAALCVLALEDQGVGPSSGPILVTGATGGVGSIAVGLLAAAGFDVIASTGKTSEADYLTDLGATEILDRTELSDQGRPLAKERWAGAVDAVGSHTLANVLAGTSYGGTVAACGLAQGMDLPASVAPFILRGVSLIGIDSVMAPTDARIRAWDRLARDLSPTTLDSLSAIRPLADAPALAEEILAGSVKGRIVFEIP